MADIIIRNGSLVNRGEIKQADILIKDGKIEKIAPSITASADREIDASGLYIMPGIIDDQVHFRDPGLTHKADLYTESRAAVAGGVTSFMEMPNTKPAALTQELLEAKYTRASEVSLANYSFFMGASNDNLEEVLKTNPRNVCGIKAFMGSSTGNMLVDDPVTLEDLFSQTKLLIATHCEDETTVRSNEQLYKSVYGEDVPVKYHPEIRNAVGCLRSSALAVELAKKHNARLHILHISTAEELALFDNTIPLEEKRITAEVCVHHLFFNSSEYEEMGTHLKCNPAVKNQQHQAALWEGLMNDKLDIIATDHAPHTLEEKANTYFKAPSGLPLVQHSLNVMLDFYAKGKISLEQIVHKMCHAPAICFDVEDRGYLDEGSWADIVIFDPAHQEVLKREDVLYKCGWSPLEGRTLQGKIHKVLVNGHLAWNDGQLDDSQLGQRLLFNR